MNRTRKIFFGMLILLFSLFGFIEDESLKELTEKFNSFNEIFPQHKLALTFNQPEYAPGDTAYFKAYLLGEDLKPIEGRQVASLVLIDADGMEVNRESFTITNGVAGNQTVLPEDLPAGVYKLVAYTHWMRNFSSRMYFTTLFTVAGDNYFTPQSDLPILIELFPEGGNLVAGIPTKIVASASRGGVPVGAEGRIVDAQGNEVTSFTCNKTGLASFELTMSSDRQYSLEVVGGLKTSVAVEKEGYQLQVDNERELLKASIRVQSKRANKESVYVVATSRSKIRYASMISLTESEPASVFIPIKNIPEGILQVTLFDSKMKELASRLVYVNRSAPDISIQLNKENVETRSAVSFAVSATDETGNKKSAEYAISAIYSDLFSGIGTDNFRDQLLVGSDVPESIYFLRAVDLSTEEGLSLLDAFLVTKKWERFQWEDILDNKKKAPAYKPQDILVYEGLATFKDNGKPVPDSTQVMFFLQKNIFGYEVNTRDNGKLSWPVYFDFYGDETAMYSMESRGKTLANTTITLQYDSLLGIKAPSVTQSNSKDPYYGFNTLTKVANTSFNYGWNTEASVVGNVNPNEALEDELNGADFTIKVDDYVVFPTIEDLFREVIRFVQNRRVGGKATLRVLSTDSNNPMMGDPLYVVDGVATKNTDYILSMNPGDIAIIKVVNDVKKLRNLGSITKNGVVFFQTKVSNMGSLIPKDDILNIRGLNKPEEIRVTPNQFSERTPYLKSTVYWNSMPMLTESGNVSDTFYAADNTGKIKLRVRGITSDGIPFDEEKEMQVAFRPN